jgi:hypothetical protein
MVSQAIPTRGGQRLIWFRLDVLRQPTVLGKLLELSQMGYNQVSPNICSKPALISTDSFGYASVDSLDMSWLPLSRFESRAVCVAVSRRERGARCYDTAT